MNSAELLHPRKYAAAMAKLRASLDVLDSAELAVGFPKGKAPKPPTEPDGPKTMADIATIAAINDAERPFLAAGLKAGSKMIRAAQYKAVEMVFDGGRPIDAIGMVGEVAAARVRDYIIRGDHKRNADSTIARKKSTKPLIDTGQMKATVTFSIRRRG